jgi:hypothetical protein
MLDRGAPLPGIQEPWRQCQHPQEVRPPMAYLHGSLRPEIRNGRGTRTWASEPTRHSPEADLGEGLHLQPWPPEETPVQRGDQEAEVRVVRPRGGLEGTPYVLDPRSHQWRRHGPSPREPTDRLSELRCDVRYALRKKSSTRTRLRRMRRDLCAEQHPSALLLVSMLSATRVRDAGRPSPSSTLGVPCPERRKVERPSYDQLLREIEQTSYLAVGRKYGVSDNAIRKWVRWYEREAERLRMEGELANASQIALPGA